MLPQSPRQQPYRFKTIFICALFYCLTSNLAHASLFGKAAKKAIAAPQETRRKKTAAKKRLQPKKTQPKKTQPKKTTAKKKPSKSRKVNKNLWARLNPFSPYNKKKRVLKKNRLEGADRERVAFNRLRLMHPFSIIIKEPVILTANGKPAIDTKTGEKRRFDFAIIGLFSKKLVEVKPPSQAGFTNQKRKSERIFSKYKNLFIRNRDGNLIRVRSKHLPMQPMVIR